jgi:MOSC domain-containing protein YiiM
MAIVSLNVGTPREVTTGKGVVATGIFKTPVAGRVRLRFLNLDGDRQADLTVHGGADKAVYVYSADYYPAWQAELGRELPWGAFGENLDVDGCLEDDMCVGDTIGAGTSLLQVTEPRLPCFKLGIKFGDAGMIKTFLDRGRTGFYVRVLAEGDIGAGDAFTVVERDAGRVPVSEITRLYTRDRGDVAAIRRVLGVAALGTGWRQHFEKRLGSPGDGG